MLPDHFTIRGAQFARSVRQRFARLFQISIDELGVIAPRDEADLLRVRLLRDLQAEFARLGPDVGLLHVADREQSPAQLLLRQPEQKIALVATLVHAALQYPALAGLIELDAGVVASRNLLRSNLSCLNQ